MAQVLTAKEKAQDRRLQKLYRITLAERREIEKFQREHPCFRKLLGKNLGTDHRHDSGLVRGLLDWRINKALGLLEAVTRGPKLAELVMALALYLEEPPATTVLGKPRYGIIGKAKVKKKMVYGPPEKK